jgi:hypothetical protein
MLKCAGKLLAFSAAQGSTQEAEVVGNPHNAHDLIRLGHLECHQLHTHTSECRGLGNGIIQLILQLHPQTQNSVNTSTHYRYRGSNNKPT